MATRQVSVAWPDADFQSVGGVGMSRQPMPMPGMEYPKVDRAPETSSRVSRPKMSKKGRAAARARQKSPHAIASGTPTTMPSSKQRMRKGMNPTLNNPNDIGAVIIPQGTPSTL